MSNHEIDWLMRSEIGYKGTFMRDEKLPKSGNFILNLDSSANEGTHWTAVSIKNGKMFYFDPFAMPCPRELDYIKDKTFNRIQLQNVNSNLCGLIAVFVLKMLNRGKSFYEICYSLLKSKPIKKNNNNNVLKQFLRKVQEDNF